LSGHCDFSLLVSLVASAAISLLSDYINFYLPFSAVIVSAINTLVSLSLIALLFGAIYKNPARSNAGLARR
jgi:membrane protein